MVENTAPILDANLNRVAEGYRVIEEYTRFISHNVAHTQTLSQLRKQVSQSEQTPLQNLVIRDTAKDVRAMEKPRVRNSLYDLLKANFKRVEEGLRVLEEYTGNALYNRLRYETYQLEKDIILTHLKPQIQPGIYLISDQVDILKQGLDWGVSLIQLRDKFATKTQLLTRAKKLQPLAKRYNIPLIINDFLDIALEVDADGLHTGQDDLPLQVLRKHLGPHKLLGRTTHTLKQGLQAQKEGADYVSVGPLWETPSKPNRKGIGFDYLTQAHTQLTVPYVAIGGINLERLEQILPFRPPLIGLIRDYQQIPVILERLNAH